MCTSFSVVYNLLFSSTIATHIHEVNVKTACSMQCINTETLTETKIQIWAPSPWFTYATPETKNENFMIIF
jgi:hypothetical protein